FFFSSRRRHTRSKRDWSSDVCSSDLDHGQGRVCVDQGPLFDSTGPTCVGACTSACAIEMALAQPLCTGENVPPTLMQRLASAQEIGRASCRERVQAWAAASSVKE